MSNDPVSIVAPRLKSGNDARILALFHRWVEETRREDNRVACSEIEREINRFPSKGPLGLAAKMYVYFHWKDDLWRLDPAALSAVDPGDVEEYIDVAIQHSILCDMVRFLPELEPLVADYINETPAWVKVLGELMPIYETAMGTEVSEDPVATWAEARFTLWDTCNSYASKLPDLYFEKLVGRVNELTDELDRRIAKDVATTAAGVSGQVRLLSELASQGPRDHGLRVELTASINAGIARLARPVG
jgi:hypothetical protein